MIRFLLISILLLGIGIMPAQPGTTGEDPKEIIRKSDEKFRGKTSKGEITMSIIRPTWTREISIKSWSLGNEYSLILITGPARDKGTTFLKRDQEIWNWQPNIDRVIKLPPSMMMQSWMGSDFRNDDIVKESSIVEDYTHKLLGNDMVEDRDCYKIEMIPHEDVAVVWGKVITWISKEEFMQLKTEFYDEDGFLVHTILGKDIKTLGGKLLPSVLEVIPEEDEGHKTVIEQHWIIFDEPMKDNFFSIQNMKRVR